VNWISHEPSKLPRNEPIQLLNARLKRDPGNTLGLVHEDLETRADGRGLALLAPSGRAGPFDAELERLRLPNTAGRSRLTVSKHVLKAE